MIKEALQGRFMKHPLHPLVVHIPVGLWIASFISDIAFLIGGNPNFAIFSYYSLLIGLFGVALALPTGLAEFASIPRNTRPKQIATTHLVLNLVVSVLVLFNVLSRYNLEAGVPTLITRGQFVLSLVSIAILGVSGYLGGLLVYDHGIGFKPQLRGRHHEADRDLKRVA